MPTPVGDERTRDGRGDSAPRRARRPHSYPDEPGTEALTVEQLIAKAGGGRGARRRATHGAAQESRPEPPAPGRAARPPSEPPSEPPSPRGALPPVPPNGFPPFRSGPLPGPADRAAPWNGLPRPADRAARTPAPPAWPVPSPGRSPVRHSTPVPPLPGRRPSGTEASASPRRQRAARPPLSPGRRRLLRIVGALGAVIGLVVLYHLGLYVYVDRSIGRVPALATDGPEVLAPQLQADTQNYLVVGTGVPGQRGAASVATLLVSVSGDGKHAALVSVPPTVLVDTPQCRTPAGNLREPTTEAFAAALLDGGPSCLVRAVQQLSGMRIDHYLGVDLGRLPGLVDALGGVPVCVVPSPALDAAATPLPAGRSQLSGAAATGYLRAADAAADVTGAAVAERAQLLLTSTLRAAMSRQTLTNTLTLTRFLVRAADALTVDEETTLGDLRTLGAGLGRLSGGAVQRASLPVSQSTYVPAGSPTGYMLVDRAAARSLFDAVIGRTEVPTQLRAGTPPPNGQQAAGDASAAGGAPAAGNGPPAGGGPAPAGQGATVPPGRITVDVLNGTGVNGLAGTVADALRQQGFGVGSVGNEPGAVSQTLVRYGADMAEQARTVAAAVPGATLQAADALGGKVQLVVGPGYSTVVPVQPAPAGPAGPTAASPGNAAQPVRC